MDALADVSALPRDANMSVAFFQVSGCRRLILHLGVGSGDHAAQVMLAYEHPCGACGLLPALTSVTPVTFVMFPGLAAFNDVTSSGDGILRPRWAIGASNADGDYLSLAFTTPQVPARFEFGSGSLVGFAGGTIIGNGVLFSIQGIPFIGAGFSGTITPARVNVAEPAALGMFGVGVLLIGLFAGLCRRVA